MELGPLVAQPHGGPNRQAWRQRASCRRPGGCWHPHLRTMVEHGDAKAKTDLEVY